MLITVRQQAFETNSSSTHSLTIVSGSEYAKWQNGELLFDGRDFIEPDKLDEWIRDKFDNRSEWCKVHYPTIEDYSEMLQEDDEYPLDYETYFDTRSEYLETFIESKTLPSGEEVVVFGEFGYDG